MTFKTSDDKYEAPQPSEGAREFERTQLGRTQEQIDQDEEAAFMRIFSGQTASDAMGQSTVADVDDFEEFGVTEAAEEGGSVNWAELERQYGDEPAPEEPSGESAEETAAPAGDPEPGDNEQSAVDEERRLAEAVLRQDGGWTAEDLKALPRDRVIAIAEHRRKNQSDVDAAFAELQQFRSKGVQPGEGTGSEKEAGHPPESSVSGIAEALALDDEGTQLLAKWQDQMTAPLQQAIDELRTQIAKPDEEVHSLRLDIARRDLVERFPKLADANGPDTRAVHKLVGTLQQDPRNANAPASDLFETAALLHFSDEIRAKASEADNRLRHARRNGQVTTQRTKQRASAQPSAKLNSAQIEEGVFKILAQGGTKEQAQAWKRKHS